MRAVCNIVVAEWQQNNQCPGLMNMTICRVFHCTDPFDLSKQIFDGVIFGF